MREIRSHCQNGCHINSGISHLSCTKTTNVQNQGQQKHNLPLTSLKMNICSKEQSLLIFGTNKMKCIREIKKSFAN